MLLSRQGSRTSEKISKRLGLSTSEVSRHVNGLVQQGLIRLNESQEVFAQGNTV